MIEARHTLTGKLLADYCSGPYMDRFFHRIDMVGTKVKGEYPVLMLANHFSWWDGFIQYRLNKELFGRRLYVMMLEEQLCRHKIMNRCGCFSVRKNSRSSVDTMRYAAAVMEHTENMVLIFPQGCIGSIYLPGIEFESGADYLIKRIDNAFKIVFNVNMVDYGSYKKPALTIYHKTVDPGNISSVGLQKAFNSFYGECLAAQTGKVW
ncbi:MAG: lysophospholipid acyltransferase family protein [Rikenellaceae bacterium]|nr:lysophospholipid acyltransferase family protein [Rikenellaceae bacterium]